MLSVVVFFGFSCRTLHNANGTCYVPVENLVQFFVGLSGIAQIMIWSSVLNLQPDVHFCPMSPGPKQYASNVECSTSAQSPTTYLPNLHFLYTYIYIYPLNPKLPEPQTSTRAKLSFTSGSRCPDCRVWNLSHSLGL